jgi:hypothetical protein
MEKPKNIRAFCFGNRSADFSSIEGISTFENERLFGTSGS